MHAFTTSRRAIVATANIFIFVACFEGTTAPVNDAAAKSSSGTSAAASALSGDPSILATPVPITDLGTGKYLTYAGGLYGVGLNTMPAAHATVGTTRARAVRPRDATGAPSASGKIVVLSIGMSNTSQEFCTQLEAGTPPCTNWSFVGRVKQDPSVNPAVVLVNGAKSFQVAQYWLTPTAPNYNRVRDSVLKTVGLTENQVQVVWLKVTNLAPAVALPAANADAVVLEREIGQILRALRVRYPFLKQVFLSSRIYGGYGGPRLNPEPYAYETGFSVKWAIGAQITQMVTGAINPTAGDLNYTTVAPWVAWGPYMWANGSTPRADGLKWVRSSFETDGTHPSQGGEAKVATLLLNFFKGSPHTACWFLAGRTC